MVRGKNKILWLLLPACVVIAVITIGGNLLSRAEQTDSFEINGSVLLGYQGTDTDITIPSGVTEIGAHALEANQSIRKIVIPEGVQRVGDRAFSNCLNLEEVTVADSVTEIGEGAFDGCRSLQKVTVGKGLCSVSNGAFSDCDSLSDISIDKENPSLVCRDGMLLSRDETVLYQYLAGNPESFVRLPDRITQIRPYAFWGCDEVTQLVFSSGLKKLDSYAAANCKGLQTAVISQPVQEIGMGAFADDAALTQLALPASVTRIHEDAFTAVNPDMIIYCEKDSYAENYALSEDYHTEELSSLQLRSQTDACDEKDASHGAAAGKEMAVSSNGAAAEKEMAVSSNESAAEKGKESVSAGDDRNSEAENAESAAGEGRLLGDAVIVSDRAFVMLKEPVYNEASTRTQTGENGRIQDGKVADYAFYKDQSLGSFEPDTLSGYGIEQQTVETLKEIGTLAFARSGITKAVLPDGLQKIGYGAFYHADNLKEVTIPSSITFIDRYAFTYTPWLTDWKQNGESDFLIVGDGILLSYKGNEQEVTVPESVHYVASDAFKDKEALRTVILPNALRQVETAAFVNCPNLTDISVDGRSRAETAAILREKEAVEQCPKLVAEETKQTL